MTITYGESGWTYGMAAKTYGGGDFVIPPTVIIGSNADTDDLLSLANGVRQRVDCFRFDIVDQNGNILGDVHPQRSGQQGACFVTNDTTRTEFRSMGNFNLDANEAASINPSSDWIRPALTLQNGATFPLGVFLFSDDSRAQRSWGDEMTATLSDQTYILDQQIGRNVSFTYGTNAIDAAVSIASEVITAPIDATAAPTIVSAPLGWKLDTTRLRIIQDLLSLASYFPPYFDNLGRLVFRPCVHPPFFTSLPPYEAGTRIIKDTAIEENDLLRAPNRYIVYDNGNSASPITGLFDVPPDAPNSFANRGFYVTKSVGKQGITDSAQAAQMAMTEYHTDTDQYRTVQFDSTADPRHDTFDVVQYLGTQYLELGWNLDLRAGGHMTHRLRRLYEG